MVPGGTTPYHGTGPLLAALPGGVVALEFIFDPLSSCAFLFVVKLSLI
jgi:hypothetical protein